MIDRSSTKILVVDDEPGIREFLNISLRHRGYDVQTVTGGAKALHAISDAAPPFDVVLTDLTMPTVDGMEVLRHANQTSAPPAVIVMTAFATADTAVEAMKLGAHDYLTKPFKLDELHLVLDRIVAQRHVIAENQKLKEELAGAQKLDAMIARSPSMLAIFDLIRRAAPTPSNVLIRGESGTGKELVARALHTLSPMAAEPWIPVNCAAIPGELLESELFGHVKGAFTGALQERIGLFESAGKGTIFLDEIGEMELSMQAKLLRVLQERKIRCVGSSEEREVHCRVLTATHRDLQELITEGLFREDLYFRLNVIQIQLPPLRERREDIPLLVERFFQVFNARMGGRLSGISADAMRALIQYDYPGNIRELQNVIERAVALEPGEVLGMSTFPNPTNSALFNERVSTALTSANHGSTSPAVAGELEYAEEQLRRGLPVNLDGILAELERRLIDAALACHEGQRREAAEQLGITQRSLRYRLAKHSGNDASGNEGAA